MQRMSSFLPWDRKRTSRKTSLDKIFSWADKSSPTALSPSNAPRQGKETFWPANLDKECDRAARILKSFCSDGFLAGPDDATSPARTSTELRTPTALMKKIPPRVIQNAAGIAIFTCMRSGLWMTGSGGSGILIARKADGTWSPPSGLLLHTPTLSFVIGVDIYDCVLVINNIAALESLTRPSVTLGEDIGLTNGPLVSVGSPDFDIRWNDLGNTVLTYLKARGQAQHVNLHGCILTERANENERFYSGNLSVLDILAGNVPREVEDARPLFEVIKAAEGRTDADPAVLNYLSSLPAPGDAVIETPQESPVSPKPAFGIPNVDDPDPFGVLALEMAGLEIREAGTKLRPSSNQFEFNPSPTSPVYPKFGRQSVDTYTSRSNRGSYMSTKTERTKMSDACTQTDVGITPGTTPSPAHSDDGLDAASYDMSPTRELEEIDYTKIDLTPLRHISGSHTFDAATNTTESAASTDEHAHTDMSVVDDAATKASSVYTKNEEETDGGDADDEEEDEEEDEDEPVIYEIAAAVQPARAAAIASPIQVKGSLVTIPKRIAPPLPARSPARTSRASKSEIGEVSHLRSPLRSSFGESVRESLDEAHGRSDEADSLVDTADVTIVAIADKEEEVQQASANKTEGEVQLQSLAMPDQETAYPAAEHLTANTDMYSPAKQPSPSPVAVA